MEYGAKKRDLTEVWTDMKKHPFITSGLLLLFGLASIGIFAGYKFLDVKLQNYFDGEKELKAEIPSQTLTYKRLNQEQKEGFWHTLFEITIVYPAGNTNPRSFIPITGIYPDAECEQGSDRYQVEPLAGLATTTRTFLISCITKERILDNGNLFGKITE